MVAVLRALACSDMRALENFRCIFSSLTSETPAAVMLVALMRVCFLQRRSTCRTQSIQQRTM